MDSDIVKSLRAEAAERLIKAMICGGAICFDGNAGALLGKILDFKLWNKKGEK